MTDINKTKKWLVRINGHEGGYWDDPVGGPTKWGISKRSYPHLDIPNLSLEDAAVIYEKDFIRPISSRQLPDGITFQLIDFSVHSGIRRAVKELQRWMNIVIDGNKVEPDGVIGPYTRAKILSFSDSDLVMIIIAARLKFLKDLSNWQPNSRGWADRMANNLLYGVEDTE
jgi:lysozyme family protein